MDKVSNFRMGRDGKGEREREKERNKEMGRGRGREGEGEKREGGIPFSQRRGKVVVSFSLLYSPSKAAVNLSAPPTPSPGQGLQATKATPGI